MSRRTSRALTAVATTVAVVLSAVGASFGAVTALGLVGGGLFGDLHRRPDPSPVAAVDRPAPATVAAQPTLAARPEPAPVAAPGDRGERVRALQHRLSQLAWYVPPITGVFDAETTRGVRGFQRKRGLEATGVVDERTWDRLLRMTRRPTDDEMFNRAGPALFRRGDSGPTVREIQARLRQIGWFYGDVSDAYADQTVAAVRGFQAKRMIPVTGEVDRRTLDLLHGMTSEPSDDELANRPPDPADGAALDPRCTTGRALCIDKSSNSLRWVVDGDVRVALDVRFGRDGMETREGQFAVSYKSRDHVSSLYDTSMPYAMFFSGGQAVHYSPDFAANGYNGASHGCVNVRDYDAIAWLFDQVGLGDKVVVYWS